MKRLSVILVVVVSLSTVAFTALWERAHQEHIATPAEIKSWEAAFCDGYASGHPLPPLYVGHGKWETMSCNVNGA
jgi:hypothetical protein